MINKEYKTVIMSNMASDIQLAEIYQVFNKFGTIHTILVNWPVLSSENSKILGEVTIQYDTMLEAHKAQKETNGAVFNGNVLQASLLK
jgi:dethiobiotin synthetase